MSETSEEDEIRERKAAEYREQRTAPEEPVHVAGPDHFQELIGSGVVLVDFYADWCGPCKMLEPVVESIAAETATTVLTVDVDSQQALARDYNAQGVPTLFLFVDGEQVEHLVGARNEETVRSLVAAHA
jgi:thioredoxin 1